MRHLLALVTLAAVACECGEAPSSEGPPDLAFLFGEGEVPEDAPSTELGVADAPGLDAEPGDLDPMDRPIPDLEPSDAGDPCARAPMASLSASEAVRRAVDLDGFVIEVVATASVGAVACTERPCPDGTSCCNSCRAALRLDGVLPLVGGPCVGTATVGCFGNPCDPLVCSPPALGAPARYEGTLRSENDGAVLELHRAGP